MKPKIVYRNPNSKEDPFSLLTPQVSFVPVFDATDHFHFVCPKCREIADVLLVERDDSYAKTPTVYFHLRCPICGAKNFRKIYLEDTGKHGLLFPVEVKFLAETAKEMKPGIVKRRRARAWAVPQVTWGASFSSTLLGRRTSWAEPRKARLGRRRPPSPQT